MTGRRGRRCNQLWMTLRKLEDTGKLKEKAGRSLWGTGFGRVYGPVVSRRHNE
jgi:hypothetical protein